MWIFGGWPFPIDRSTSISGDNQVTTNPALSHCWGVQVQMPHDFVTLCLKQHGGAKTNQNVGKSTGGFSKTKDFSFVDWLGQSSSERMKVRSQSWYRGTSQNTRLSRLTCVSLTNANLIWCLPAPFPLLTIIDSSLLELWRFIIVVFEIAVASLLSMPNSRTAWARRSSCFECHVGECCSFHCWVCRNLIQSVSVRYIVKTDV